MVFEWMPFRATESSDRYELGYYDASHYDYGAVNGVLTKDDIELVFDKLSESETFLPRVNYNRYPDDLCLYGLALIVVTTALFAFGGITLAITFENFLWLPIIIFTFLALTIAALTYIGIPSDAEVLQTRQKSFDQILRILNQTVFKEREFSFSAGENGSWIEVSFNKAIPSLGAHHKELQAKVYEEIENEMSDTLYLNGFPPINKKSWN